MNYLLGIAALITSTGTFIATMVGLYRGRERDKKLDTIQTHVNGMNQTIERLAFKAGGDAERENPTER